MSTNTQHSTCILEKKKERREKKVGAPRCKLHLPLILGMFENLQKICFRYVLVSSKHYSTPQHLAGISECCGGHTLPESYFYTFSDTKLPLLFQIPKVSSYHLLPSYCLQHFPQVISKGEKETDWKKEWGWYRTSSIQYKRHKMQRF